MLLSQAYTRSKSVINTLRALNVPDYEIKERLVNNMGLSEPFVVNQLNLLIKAKTSDEVYLPKEKPGVTFTKGSLTERVFKYAGMRLFDKPHMKILREQLRAEGYSDMQINSAFGAVRTKVRSVEL